MRTPHYSGPSLEGFHCIYTIILAKDPDLSFLSLYVHRYFRPFLIRRFTKREVHRARVDMQRRTNEWYQGLREASSDDEEEEDIVVELETTFTSNQLSPSSSSGNTGRGGAKNSSYKSPPPPGYDGRGYGGRGLKGSPTAASPLWTDVNLEGSGHESGRGSHSSNSELGFVRDRTCSRSPPSGDGTGSS